MQKWWMDGRRCGEKGGREGGMVREGQCGKEGREEDVVGEGAEGGVSGKEAHHTVVESWSEDINPHDL